MTHDDGNSCPDVMQLLHYITQSLPGADPTKFIVTTEKLYNSKQKYIAFVSPKTHATPEFVADVVYKCYENDTVIYGICNHKSTRSRLTKWQSWLPHAKLYTLTKKTLAEIKKVMKSCDDKLMEIQQVPSGVSTPALSEVSVQQTEKSFYKECFDTFKSHLDNNVAT